MIKWDWISTVDQLQQSKTNVDTTSMFDMIDMLDDHTIMWIVEWQQTNTSSAE